MLADWIENHGTWLVLFGGIFEGEAVFIAAGYAISQGYLHPAPTLLVAILGCTLGDHFFYFAGRSYGASALKRFPLLRRPRAHAIVFLRRWGRPAAFLTRFAYGLRSVIPMSMGMARYPGTLFVPFNVLGSVVFATLYLSAGYLFGEAMEEVLRSVRRYEFWILIGIFGTGLLAWIAREWRIWRGRPPAATEPPPVRAEGRDRAGG